MPAAEKPWTRRPSGKRSGNPGRPTGGAGPTTDPDRIQLYGIHAAAAALANPGRRIRRALLTENAERRLKPALVARGVATERVLPRDLDRILGADAVHQGALLEAEPLAAAALEALARRALANQGPVLALDQVTDPHNVGAVLRSAAVLGAAGLLTTRRHSPPLTGALAKAASGALDLVAIALEQNLARSLAELKSQGLAVIGLDGGAEALLEDADLARPAVLVLGAEGRGLRQLTKETCTELCRIGTTTALASLNVSNAAAVALHALSTQTGRCSSRPAR